MEAEKIDAADGSVSVLRNLELVTPGPIRVRVYLLEVEGKRRLPNDQVGTGDPLGTGSVDQASFQADLRMRPADSRRRPLSSLAGNPNRRG